ncbi:hypothetical protein GQ44DRAFT_775961 [Phaeosphaeriaceae sp. PMI808]|nr:hypothetical protein GQ44DRAFT_775961 [Phaeosphaeriaceae sp. PMI808]
MSGDFKYSVLNELLGAFSASFAGGGLPAAKEEFREKFREEIEQLSTNHKEGYGKIENLAYGDALANGGFEKKGLLGLCTGDSQIAFRAIDNIWVKAPIKEWGKDDWVDMISARYLRENFASQKYAYSLTDSRIFETFLGATSLPGIAEMKMKDSVMGAISQVESATIENGEVVVKAPSLKSSSDMFIDDYGFPVWISCPDPDKWAKVAFFCANQRSVHKKLIETWASEEINGKSVRLFTRVYNAYTRTRSRLIKIQPILKAIQNVLKMLELVVDRLLLRICDLQGNIMAGEACSMQLDFGRLEEALDEVLFPLP